MLDDEDDWKNGPAEAKEDVDAPAEKERGTGEDEEAESVDEEE